MLDQRPRCSWCFLGSLLLVINGSPDHNTLVEQGDRYGDTVIFRVVIMDGSGGKGVPKGSQQQRASGEKKGKGKGSGGTVPSPS